MTTGMAVDGDLIERGVAFGDDRSHASSRERFGNRLAVTLVHEERVSAGLREVGHLGPVALAVEDVVNGPRQFGHGSDNLRSILSIPEVTA